MSSSAWGMSVRETSHIWVRSVLLTGRSRQISRG